MRKVYCSKLKKEAEGLEFKFYPGDIGQRIFDEISKEAWAQWQKKQTMLINEQKLNMINADHRQLIESKMIDFLFNDVDVHIEGYVPKDDH